MRIVAHLSDLHFGRVERAVLEPLRRRLVELAPDLVVISGDLTQRARAQQFREARAYLDTLPKPQVVVPGNHDVPLYNVFARFLRPLAAYRRIICEDLEPSFVDEEIAVLGINTARSFVFKGGRVSDAQLARVRGKLCHLNGQVVKILVSHHPFMALEQLVDCGIDVLVAGHLHATRIGSAVDQIPGFSALLLQAGTATSRRTREEPNSFNLLRIAPRRIEVEQHVLRGGGFERAATEAFSREDGGWGRGRAA
jgi:predicted MPP superfamily phosphohydrolase